MVATAALFIAMASAVGGAGPTSSEAAWATSCTPGSLAGAFGGALVLDSLDNFGCHAGWAFAWATVGTSPNEIGVTEVLRYRPASETWEIASRLRWCKPARLPQLVYKLGCFSN